MNRAPSFTNNSQNSMYWLLAGLALALASSARGDPLPTAIPFSEIGARATASYQGDALGVAATADGARLRCGFQKLEGYATREGLWLESTKPSAAGRLRLVASAVSRLSTLTSQPSTRLPATGKVSVSDKVVRFTRPGLTEEYTVSVDGVRQDFVIAAPPAGAGDLRVELALSGARAEAAASGVRLTFEGSGRTLAYSRLRVEDATGRELTARLEVLSAIRLAVSVSDASATYPVRIDPTFSDANWSALGSGIAGTNPYVFALAVSGTNLYAGGGFTSAGGVQATNIARWDGSAWSALGLGMGSYVRALAVSGTNLYAGGNFATAGGVPASSIARWDGSAWSALGLGMSNNVNPPSVGALLVSGANLYAGGRFAYAGGVLVNNIARWDGSTWSALGSGFSGDMNCQVKALAVSGTNLYAAGWFTAAGGMAANNIARWDGNAWSVLGSGLSGGSHPYVYALAVSGSDLYAGGAFTTAGGVSAFFVARWNGSAWSALGSGMCCGYSPVVSALAVSGTDLCVGGSFTNAGGVAVGNIAKWNGSVWSPMGSGLNNSVYALAADGAGHLFVGGSFSVAGTNVSPCIAEAVLPAPSILQQPTNQIVLVGSEVELTVAAAGIGPLFYQWLFNSTNTARIASTDCCLVLTNVQHLQAGTYTVVITNAYGAVTSAPAMLTVLDGSPPNIVTAPSSQSVWIGASVDFSAWASGLPPISYHWYFNSTNAEGAGPNLHLADVQLAQAGAYTVVVSNLYGAVTSAPAWLTVTGVPPSIVSSPTNQTSLTGGSVILSVVAAGTFPLAYQWFAGASAVAQATSSTLQLTNLQLAQSGVYTVVVTNLYGAATSAPALLQVFPAGIVVTNSEAALRAAMAAGGTVTFACDGTIRLSSTITIDSDTRLDGSGRQVAIFGEDDNYDGVQVFILRTNVHFTIVNLAITGGGGFVLGGGGGAIANEGGIVNASYCSFSGHSVMTMTGGAGGGAILNWGGTLNATNCSFSGNRVWAPWPFSLQSAQVSGGAIRNHAGQAYLRSCAFVDNRASGGSASTAGGADGDWGLGGAIHNSGMMTLDLCTFTGNAATGGAGLGAPYGWATLPGFRGGDGSGGAIFNEGTLRVDRCSFSGNSGSGGDGGAGGYPPSSSPTLDGYGGGAGGDAHGGAIYNLGSCWISCSTLVGNGARGGNGGVGGSGVTAENPHFGGNGGYGGPGGSAFGELAGAAFLVNCTIAFNSGSGGAGGDGGAGAWGFDRGGTGGGGGTGGTGVGGVAGTGLTNCTVAGNRGTGGLGGTGGDAGGSPSLPGVPGYDGVDGSAWGGTSCTNLPNTLIASNTPAGGDTFPDPKLGPLADNGGPTLTMALLPGSPAIDAGNTSLTPATDQRGFPRPAGLAADIGAFEYGSVMPAIAINLSGTTNLTILGTGNAGQRSRLLSSPDLTSWVPVATNQIGGDGTVLFYDTCGPGSACRFYRLVTP